MRQEIEKRINSLTVLGAEIKALSRDNDDGSEAAELLRKAEVQNGWFTEEQVRYALAAWGDLLSKENLTNWVKNYTFDDAGGKIVAVIAAGNIPLVGLHDVLSVLISGHKLQLKLSSNDDVLLTFLLDKLVEIDSSLAHQINIRKQSVKDYDAVIATGSDNTARYFEHYFKGKPNIVRKNRNSVAVLTGDESSTQLEGLADDIFRYYGLGCRSVSKLYVPEGYDFDLIFKAVYPWNRLLQHKKYENNYDYNKAVFLMSQFQFLENGFFMIKKDERMASPIASVFYENYRDLDDLQSVLDAKTDKIQCVVADAGLDEEIPFGSSQTPALGDYADGVDTLEFLLKL